MPFGLCIAPALKLQPHKCHLFQRKVKYLGHSINTEEVSTEKLKKSSSGNTTTVKQMHVWRGLAYSCLRYRVDVKDS